MNKKTKTIILSISLICCIALFGCTKKPSYVNGNETITDTGSYGTSAVDTVLTF